MSTTDATDQGALAAELARLVPAGADIQLASASGVCARVRAKLAADDLLVGAALAGRVQPGDAVSTRVWSDGQVHVLHFAVEDVEPTVLERVDLLMRLVRIDVIAEERREARYACDLDATVVPALVAELQPDARPLSVRVVGVSLHGLEFIADRGFREGEELDVAYEDTAGGRIRGRIRVQRVAAPLYGRSRHGCRILAISQTDGRRHAHLVSRLDLASRPAPVPEAPAPRAGRMRRLLRAG